MSDKVRKLSVGMQDLECIGFLLERQHSNAL